MFLFLVGVSFQNFKTQHKTYKLQKDESLPCWHNSLVVVTTKVRNLAAGREQNRIAEDPIAEHKLGLCVYCS